MGGCESMPFKDDNLAAVAMNDQIHVIGHRHWVFIPPHLASGSVVDEDHDGDIDGLDLSLFTVQLNGNTNGVGTDYLAKKFGGFVADSGCGTDGI